MTNVFATPQKRELRGKLISAAEQVLEKQGWKVERILGAGKSSVRRIVRPGESKLISIRTTQNTDIAFPRNKKDNGWATLDDVDFVVASSVNAREGATTANVHMLPGDEMRKRFDKAYAARKNAKYSIPVGRGIWLPLYQKEANYPVTLVGAGAGLAYPPIGSIPLKDLTDSAPYEVEESEDVNEEAGEPAASAGPQIEAPLSIAEAKRRLAQSLGVSIDQITITITS